MKKNVTILLFLSFLLTNVYAQDSKVSIGIRGGLNIATFTNLGQANVNFGGFSSSVKNSPRLLPHVGVYSEFKLADAISVQPELLFTMKGYKSESKSSGSGSSSEVTNKVALSYLEIPIQLRVNIKGFHILGGPSFAFLLAANAKSKSVVTTGSNTVTNESESTDKDGLNTVDIGLYLGVGYQLENGVNFGVRWNRSFTPVYDNSNTNVSNSVIQITAGYRF